MKKHLLGQYMPTYPMYILTATGTCLIMLGKALGQKALSDNLTDSDEYTIMFKTNKILLASKR